MSRSSLSAAGGSSGTWRPRGTPLVRRLDHRPQELPKSGGQSFDRLVDAGTPQGELEVGQRLDVAGRVDLLVALLDRLVARRHRDVEAADPGRELDEGRDPVWATHREVERDLAALRVAHEGRSLDAERVEHGEAGRRRG